MGMGVGTSADKGRAIGVGMGIGMGVAMGIYKCGPSTPSTLED